MNSFLTNILSYLHFELGDDYAMDYVAENGYLEIVKWLHDNRTEGCTNDNGHLEIVIKK